MSKIKNLTERRGAKLEEASALIKLAETEKRELSADELTKVEAFHTEAENLARSIHAEARQMALEAAEIRQSPSEGDERDMGSFCLGRMLTRMAKNLPLEGAEAEFTREGELQARAAGISPGGVMVPRMLTRDMTATGGTNLNQGGMLVQTDKYVPVLDALFNRMVLAQAGATFLTDLVGNLDVPRIVPNSTAPGHKAENAAADERNPTFAQLSLSPKRLPVFVEVSNQLFQQASTRPLEVVVRNLLEGKLMQEMQKAILHGTAANGQPRGLAATSGIHSVTIGANGGAPTYAKIVEMQEKVDTADADMGRLAFITNSKVKAKLKTTAKIASTDSLTVIDARTGDTLDGMPYYVTNSVSSALTKGTTGANLSALFYGNWNDLWVGQWGGLEFRVNPYSKDTEALTRINASIYYDSGVVRPVSFSAILDATT